MTNGIPAGLALVERRFDQAMSIIVYVSGALFLLLSFYISFDVIGRRFTGFYSGVSDDMSSYVMAVSSTWSLAYALRSDRHVRVDVLMPVFPARLRAFLDLAAILTTGIFAAMLAIYSWKLTVQSYEIGARAVSLLQAPLFIPQGMMAVGFTLLLLQSALLVMTSSLRLAAGEYPRRVSTHELPSSASEESEG